MRLFLIFVLFLSFMDISAQDIDEQMISYQAKDKELIEVFRELEELYEIRFSYATESLKDNKLNVSFTEVTIQYFLDQILNEFNLQYKILNDNILVRKKQNYIPKRTEEYGNVYHIKGKVLGGDSSLSYATISIENSSIGTYTDEDGMFDLEIPNRYKNNNIIISFVGYESSKYQISEVDNSFVLIELEKGQYAINEITIVNQEKPIILRSSDGSITMNSSQFNAGNTGVLGSDVLRSVQLLPGISSHNDNSSDIKIRGSNSDETLIILDGMRLYNASHYYGIFSGINPAFVDEIKVYKNFYPIEYGGKTAGLLDIKSKSDLLKKSKTEIGIDLLTAKINSSIKVTKKSSLFISGRSTIKGISNNQFNTKNNIVLEDRKVNSFQDDYNSTQSNPSFKFYDANVKYLLKTSKKSSFSFNFLLSDDAVINAYNINIKDNNQNELQQRINENQDWSTFSSSILWDHTLSTSSSLHTRLFYTDYQSSRINRIYLNKKNDQNVNFNPEELNLGSKIKNKIKDGGLDIFLIKNIKTHTLKFGLLANNNHLDYSFVENGNEILKGNKNISSISSYTSCNFSISPKIKTTYGLRATYYNHLSKVFLSPRILGYYNINEKIKLKSSFSIHQQIIRELYYEYRGAPLRLWVDSSNKEIPILSSQNIMIGTSLQLKHWSIDVEAYNKSLFGTLEYAVKDPGNNNNNTGNAREYLLFSGDGKMIGLDIILSSGYKSFDTYISYSLSKSQERYDEIFRNKYYSSEDDRRHQLKWVNSFRKEKFTFDFNTIYTSGRRYTDIPNLNPNQDIRNLDPTVRLKRLPSYIRIDIGGQYKFKLGSLESVIEMSIFNVLNRRNVNFIQSVATLINDKEQPINTIIGNESNLLNRTINLGLKIQL